MEYNHWFPPASEPYPDANSLNFSVSYARQPDEATHAFGNHRHGSDAHIADSSLLPATYPVPCLQDDERLVEFANIDLTPEFEKSYCQRILFVWRVVLHLCEANHDLAFRTWVKLLDGEGEDDIWLWADGDEKCIESSCNLRSDSPGPSRDELGWKLTNSDLHMGILALARRVDRVKGRVSEGLNITERRRRLHLAHPSLRFAAIAWSISMSEAVRHADASRGVLKRAVIYFLYMLDWALRTIGLDAINCIEGTTARSEFRDYWDSMREAGHKCHTHRSSYIAQWERWIYVKSLLSPNQDLDVTILKGLCGTGCPGYEAIFNYMSRGSAQEPESENSAINLQNTTGTTQPPAMHLIFLWLFWKGAINEVINQEDKDRRSSYYRDTDVRNWLQWLKSLASYSSSRCILSLTTSKCVEDWWSKVSILDSDVDPDLVYLPWISSFRPHHRGYLARVSHFDWECARRTMESVIAQNHGAVEGRVSGCSLDICGLFGALYFCSFPNGSGDPRVDVLNDIDRFYRMGYWSVIFKLLPSSTPTSAMIEFRSALQAAHPTCCRKLGPKTIDVYSASIAFLGLTDSVDHSTWKCKCCISCNPTSGLRKLLNRRKLPSGTSKQNLFDAAVRGLAEIAADEGLRFEIPAMNASANLNGSSLSHPEKHSTTDDRSTDSSRIADRSASDTEQDSDTHAPFHAGAAATGNITSLQQAIHLPKAFMANAIKSHLIKLLEELEVPLGGIKKKQLPWTTLTNILSERGFQLENWPSEVPLPGSGSKSCDDNKGINGLDKRHLALLYEAMESDDRPLKVSEIAHPLSSPSVSMDGMTHTTGTLAPDLGYVVQSGGRFLDTTRRRGREDYTEGRQRPDKRPHLMEDRDGEVCF